MVDAGDIQVANSVASRTNPALGQDPISQLGLAEDLNPPVDQVVNLGEPNVADDVSNSGDSSGGADSSGGPSVETDTRWDALVRELGETFEDRAGTPPAEPAPVVDGAGADDGGGGDNGVGSGVVAPAVAPDTTQVQGEVQPPATAPVPNVIDLAEIGIGRDEAMGVIEWAKSLTPEMVDRINALANQGDGVATGHNGTAGVAGAPSAPVAPAPVAAGIPAQGQPGMPDYSPQAPSDLGIIAEVAPEFAAAWQAQQAQIAQMQQQFALQQQETTRIAQIEASRQQASQAQLIETGVAEFKAANPGFSEDQIQDLMRSAGNLQILPSYVQKHGSVDRAVTEALNTAMWHDPTYRDQLLQARVQDYAQTAQQIETKRGLAASLSGSSGNVSRVESAPDPKNMTDAQRSAAMTAQLAAEMGR